eukprot:gene24371-30710_t
MTEHVVTRWYRPPELMLCPDGLYDYAVDIWSCGCILAEMLGRNPLFPGKNFVHQLSLVFDVIGSPIDSDVAHIVNHEAKKFLSSQANKARMPFQKIYPHASSDAWKLLDNLLVFNPEMRFTVDEALESVYLVGVGLDASLVYPRTSPEFEFSFEYNPNVTRYQLKHMIAAEVLSFKREQMLIKARGEAAMDGIASSAPNEAKEEEPVSLEDQARELLHKQQQKQQQMNKTNSSSSLLGRSGASNRASSAPRMRGTTSAANLHAGVKTSKAPVAPAVEQERKPVAKGGAKPPLAHHSGVEMTSQQTHHSGVPVASKHHSSAASTASSASTVDNARQQHDYAQDDSDTSTVRSGVSTSSTAARGADSQMQTVDNGRSAYDQLFKPKHAPVQQPQRSPPALPVPVAKAAGQLSTSEMIARITATKQSAAAAYAAIEPQVDSALLNDFKNVSLAGYQAEMKSPTKSMRHHTGSNSYERQDKHFDEYEHKSAEADSANPYDSPARVNKSRPVSNEPNSPVNARRTIQETYMSPKRLVAPSSKREDSEFQPSITHSNSPLRRDTSSPPVRRPVYNSMMGGFDQKEDDFPRQNTASVHASRPQSAARQAPVSVGRHSVVNVISHSDDEDEGHGVEIDDHSTDSSDAGTHEKVHILHHQPSRAAEKVPVVNAGRQEYKSTADYYEQREYGAKMAVSHITQERHLEASHEDRAVEAAAHAAAAAAAKKKITVARSPKFSQMSWQRRGGGEAPVMPAPLPAPGQDKRSNSTGRHRVPPSQAGYDGHAPRRAEADEEVPKARDKAPVPVPSYMNATGSYANKQRSESASRTRR